MFDVTFAAVSSTNNELAALAHSNDVTPSTIRSIAARTDMVTCFFNIAVSYFTVLILGVDFSENTARVC
jgi:hypothetical protein